MNKLFTEKNHVVTVLAPDADRYAGDPASAPVSMANYSHACFVLSEGAGGTGTTKLTVEACDNAAGDNPVEIDFKYRVAQNKDAWGAYQEAAAATGYTTVAGANKDVAIEVESEDLPAGKLFIRVQTTEQVASATDAGIVAILSGARYGKDGTIPALS